MLLPSPTSRTASSGKPLRGLTLAALGALMLATTSCSVPEAILSGDRVNVLPEIVIETGLARRACRGGRPSGNGQSEFGPYAGS